MKIVHSAISHTNNQTKYFASRGTLEFEDIVHAGIQENFDDLKEIKSKIQMDDPVNIQFTSGTTGKTDLLLSTISISRKKI